MRKPGSEQEWQTREQKGNASATIFTSEEKLGAAGAGVEETDGDGWTALLLACDHCEGEAGAAVVRLLVGGGANMEARTPDGDTPLHRACIKASPLEVMRL